MLRNIHNMEIHDHNTITLSYHNTKKGPTNRKPAKNKIWKLKQTTNWSTYQQKLKVRLESHSNIGGAANQLNIEEVYKGLVETIKLAGEASIGRYTIRRSTNPLFQIQAVKEARISKKEARTMYSQAIQTRQPTKIQETLDTYIKCQEIMRTAIQTAENDKTEQALQKILTTGGSNSRSFWEARRKTLTRTDSGIEAVLDHTGKTSTLPDIVMMTTANYFENLYRMHDKNHFNKNWTEHVQYQMQTYMKDRLHEGENINNPITHQEITDVLKKLKNNKSASPEDIPNELLKHGGQPLSETLTKIFNHIFSTEMIPKSWLQGLITPIYKGKGTQNDPQNYRGITVNSNIEKVFERILNNRVISAINYTEAQAGGRAGRSTIDQLLILKSTIRQAKMDNRKLYVAFLDISKACDKAWLDGIMYVLWQNGIRFKIWRLIKLLNTNMTAQIKTKYGLTRVITLSQNIRQGGVLSVTQYAKMVDTMCETLADRGLGTKYGHLTISSLLLMDDITLIADSPHELQQMLNVIHNQALRHHVMFGEKKCKVITIGENHDNNWTLGNIHLDVLESY